MPGTVDGNGKRESGCSGCGASGILPLRGSKWGQCPFCMALAVTGTVTGWSLTFSFWLLYPRGPILLILACTSAAFSAVLAGHLIARWVAASR